MIPAVAMIIAFGHSLLSMSGFETLAQVYRELALSEAEESQDHREYRMLLRGGVYRRDHGLRRHESSALQHEQVCR